jgi:hypothetical protein
LADSANQIARNLKIAALDPRTFTVQYFADWSKWQEKTMKNQELASGTVEAANSHAQLTPQSRQNSQSATLR